MAASNRHRRLMEDYTNTAATNPFCKFQCDPQHNPTGICFTFCAAACPSFCRISYWSADSAPPSSSPSPATSPRLHTTPPSGSNTQIPFPLKISLLFFVGTFVYTLYKFYTAWDQSRRHRMPPSPEIQEARDNEALDHPIWHIKTAGLQLSVVNAITVVKFNKGDGVVVGTDCPVCLTEFEADDTLRLLPNCKHAFHISCIDTWLRSHTNCPLCRAGIVDAPSPEQSTGDLGFTAETDSRISVREDDDREEVSESSGLTIGEPNEDYLNRNSDLFQIRRFVSMEDFAASGHRGMPFQSVHGDSGFELVQLEQKTDNNSPKRGG